MNYNTYLLEKMMNDRLAEMRAEAMRSQMLAQAGLQNHKKLRFPELQQFLHRMLVYVTSFSPRRIERPGIRQKVVR